MRLILAALLLLAASQAAAEWLKLDDRAEALLYFDPERIAKDGILRRVWTMQDRKTPDGKALSRRAEWEFDCKEGLVRLLSFSTHADQMGLGTPIVRSSIPGPWEAVNRGTAHETLIRLACAR
jgi:hypothetical protein